MKQMISNHETIESLKDFIYFDKATGKIKITKPIVDGSGNPIGGATKTILGQSTIGCDGYSGAMTFENTNSFNYQNYDLLLLTIMGSLFVFISSQVIETDSGVKASTSMIYDNVGNSAYIKAKLNKIAEHENRLHVEFSSTQEFDFGAEHPYGILIGIKL